MSAAEALHLDTRQVTRVLSDALDLVGVKDEEHGKRVAYIAVEIGRASGLDKDQIDDLFDAGHLHDCGVSTTREHTRIMSAFKFEDDQSHCVRGYDLLVRFNPLAHLAPLIRHHHSLWNTVSDMDLALRDKLSTNCLHLADRVDALIRLSSSENVLLARKKIRLLAEKHRGIHFSPRLVEAFLSVSDSEAFWLNLESQPLRAYLERMSRQTKFEKIEINELKGLARIFAYIVDAKSSFTAEHSLGVSQTAHLLAQKVGLPEECCDLVEVAGLLHDLGKLRMPDEILDKPGPLDDEERATIMGHTFYTFRILSRIEGFEEITEWAAFHHERLDGNGYPFHHGAPRLSLEARIMAVADVFQALIQKRPYREGMPPDRVHAILEEMVIGDNLDGDVVSLLEHNFSECWEVAAGTPPPQAV